MSDSDSGSESSVFDELKQEMEDTGKSLKQLLQDARSGEGSRGDLKQTLKREAEATSRSLEQLVDDVRARAKENGRDVTEQLKEEFEQFRKNR